MAYSYDCMAMKYNYTDWTYSMMYYTLITDKWWVRWTGYLHSNALPLHIQSNSRFSEDTFTKQA